MGSFLVMMVTFLGAFVEVVSVRGSVVLVKRLEGKVEVWLALEVWVVLELELEVLVELELLTALHCTNCPTVQCSTVQYSKEQ